MKRAPQSYLIAKAKSAKERFARLADLVHVLEALAIDCSWRIEVVEVKRTRSLAQNAYLWGCVYVKILEHPELEGWTAEDIHEFMLGEHFGWLKLESKVIRRARMVPKRRSSKLSTLEFMDYVAFIQRYWSERGVIIPDPNEELTGPCEG